MRVKGFEAYSNMSINPSNGSLSLCYAAGVLSGHFPLSCGQVVAGAGNKASAHSP